MSSLQLCPTPRWRYTVSDRYKDFAEMSAYSKHFLATAPNYASLNPILELLIQEQQALVDRWEAIVAQAQSSRSDLKMTATTRRELSQQVRTALDDLYDALWAVRKSGTFDFTIFYPTNKKADSGDSIADRTAALKRCLDGFEKYPEIPNCAALKQPLLELQKQFSPVVELGSSRDSLKRADTQSLQKLRAEWKRKYRACQLIVQGLLVREARENELPGLFKHLSVPSSRVKNTDETTTSPA